MLSNPRTTVFLSAASVWEIAIKANLGKIAVETTLEEITIEEPARNGIRSLPITREHACYTGKLPPYHRDPFDRILVAQARLQGLTIVTRDPVFSQYDVSLFW